MTISEIVGVAPIIEKIIGTWLRGFSNVEKFFIDFVVRKENQIGRRKPRKTTRERKNMNINELDRDMIYDKILRSRLIHPGFCNSNQFIIFVVIKSNTHTVTYNSENGNDSFPFHYTSQLPACELLDELKRLKFCKEA